VTYSGRMTSFHNTCDVHLTDRGGVCNTHSVPVYRDGIDWLTDTRQVVA